MANVNKLNCSKSGFPDYYEVLKCKRTATAEELKKSYQTLALNTHPDKVNSHNDQFLMVQEAWNALRDPESRRIYDAQLSSAEHNDSDYLLYDVIHLSAMELSDGVYTYLCRCGSNYMLDASETDINGNSVVVDCDECSFSLKINLRDL